MNWSSVTGTGRTIIMSEAAIGERRTVNDARESSKLQNLLKRSEVLQDPPAARRSGVRRMIGMPFTPFSNHYSIMSVHRSPFPIYLRGSR
jgi:hypothetical protein